MRELEVTIKVRNNRLKRRREELGLSAPAFAEAAGICYHTYIELESLRASPMGADGDWRKPVRKIADYHGLSPDELFPPVVRAVVQPKVTRELNGDEIGRFLSAYQQQAALPANQVIENDQRKQTTGRVLALLGPREQEVVRLRFGFDGTDGHDLAGVGEKLGISRGRVRQIEIRAITKIRGFGNDIDDVAAGLDDREQRIAQARTAALVRAKAQERAREVVRQQEEEARRRAQEERAKKKEEREARRVALANRTPEEIAADRMAKERAKEARRITCEAAAKRRRVEQQEQIQLQRQRDEERQRAHEERQRAHEEWLRAEEARQPRPAGAHTWEWLPHHRTWRCDACKALAWPLAEGFSYSDVGERHQKDSPTCDPKRWAAYQRRCG